MRLSPGLKAAFACALAVVVGTAVVSSWNMRTLFEESRWVAHTQEVRAAIGTLRSHVQDAEIAERGFVVTGDDRSLEPYVEAQHAIGPALAHLRALLVANAGQLGRLDELEQRMHDTMGSLRGVVETRRRYGFPAAQARVRDGAATGAMAAVRDSLDALEGAEDAMLPVRRHDAELAARFAAGTFLVAALLASALIGVLYAVLRRHLREREGLLGAERRARVLAEDASRARAVSEERLRDAVQLREAVIANMGEGLYTVDAEGRMTSINPAAERLLGWTSAELLGRDVHEAIHHLHPDGTPFPAEECRGLRVLHGDGVVANQDDVFVRKDGSFLPVTYSAGRLGDGLVVVFRDETARRRAEAERESMLATTERARRDAEAASRAKDTFLATVSHELRTPLSPIIAWAAMLERGTLDAEQSRKALETIRRCARAQTQLIEDLLDVSRIVSGKMRLDVRPIDVRAVVEAAVDVVRPAADARGVRLETDVAAPIPPVSGDPERLQQVVWNLLVNAIKFTPAGGCVAVSVAPADAQVAIAVRDTGEGIAPEFLPHVFERFQQADASSTRQHMGLGLGLAIVRHIVEAHGGTIDAESAGKGRGAVFTVLLPMTPDLRAAADAPSRRDAGGRHAEEPSLADVRILVVDDEPASNEVVRTVLAARGADVRVAASSAQAVDVLGRWRPDVVVTDIAMPEEDGYALLARIRARERDGGRVPTIALTAYASVEDRVRLLSAGFATHVAKPVEPDELVAVVSRVAGR